MEEPLQGFIERTKQHNPSRDMVLREFLATQCPKWKQVYNMVSGNYNSISHRAPDALKICRQHPDTNLQFFLDLFKPVANKLAWEYDFLRDFAAKVGVDKELGAPLFFANRLYGDPDFVGDFEKLGLPKNTLKKMRSVIRKYNVDPMEIARLLQTVKFHPQPVMTENQPKVKAIATNNNNNNNFINNDDKKTWSFEVEKVWNKQREIKEMKQAKNLPTTSLSFPFIRTLLSLGYTENECLVDAIDYFDDDTVDRFVKVASVSPPTLMSKREFVKHYLKTHESLSSKLRQCLKQASLNE